jgi:hypothetical protein
MTAHRFNACGYSLAPVYAPCWMDWPMFFHGNPVLIAPGMVLFLYVLLARFTSRATRSPSASCGWRASRTRDRTSGACAPPSEVSDDRGYRGSFRCSQQGSTASPTRWR